MDHRLALALKYYRQGLNQAAWDALRDLAGQADADAQVLHLAAVLRLRAGAHAEALAIADRVIALDLGDAAGWLLRGQALRELGRHEEAEQTFMRAFELRTPDAGVHADLGLLYHRAGRYADAEKAYRASLDLDADRAGTWNNLGNLLDDMGRPDEAARAFMCALTLDPADALARNNLGASLAGQGRFAAAALEHGAVRAEDPSNIAACINLGVALLEQRKYTAAREAFDAALAHEASNPDAADNRLYLDIYTETDPAIVAERHAQWGRAMVAPDALPVPSGPSRPLRVGYISADFRRHSVSFFVEPLLMRHDPAAVDVFCYADVAAPDEVTARLKAGAAHWRDVRGWDDARLCEAVRADRLHILVDLAGHTRGNRLGVFARRAAPIQVTAIGYPATTGLPAMDYRLCDAITDPPGADKFAVERLARLPALHCFAPPEGAPAVAALPARTNGHITFGSFNKLAKLGPDTVRLWASVMDAVPASRLVIKSKPLVEEATRAALAADFAGYGIAADRLDMEGWKPADADHLAAYGRVDIALDTFPYNGTTTTCEALWMGVPVLTMAGASHAARVGASLLTSAGLGSWIAADAADFRARAAAISADLDALAGVRRDLRARMRAARLCDADAYARAVERAYGEMWKGFTAGNSAG